MPVVVEWREGAVTEESTEKKEGVQCWNTHGREWKHFCLLLVYGYLL